MKFEPQKLEIINRLQRNFPITSMPFHQLAKEFNISVESIMDFLRDLKKSHLLSRIGPVFQPNSIGASTLAAISVAPEKLEEVASIVSSFGSVNHNYSRTDHYNLWFVVTAAGDVQLKEEIKKIEELTKCEVLVLPLIKEYCIDLAFNLESLNE